MLRAVALAALLALAGAATVTAAAKPKKIDGNAVISFAGVGPVKLGMTLAEARKAAGHGITAGGEITKGCHRDTVLPRRFGLTTLRMGKKIRVLSVTRTAMPTAKGVRVNDSLARLRSKYGSRLQERPSDVSADTRIFELHKGAREVHFDVSAATGRITRIATGLRPEIDFDDGCA